jgi:CHAT domain-containing protein
MGRSAQAEPLYVRALKIREKALGPDHPSTAASLGNLAYLHAATSRPRKALSLLVDATKRQRRYLSGQLPLLTAAQKRRLLGQLDLGDLDAQLSLVLSGEWDFQDRDGAVRDALSSVVLSKRLLADASRAEHHQMLSMLEGASVEWRQQYEELRSARRRYATLAMQSVSDPVGGPAAAKVSPEFMRDLRAQIEQMDKELRQGNAAYAAAARVREVDLGDVRQALGPGQTLLEYVRYAPVAFKSGDLGPARYAVFVLQGDGRVGVVDLGPAEAIEQAVERYRSVVRAFIVQWKANAGMAPRPRDLRQQVSEDPSDPGVLSETRTALASVELRKLVWDKLSEQVKGLERVYIAPDGPLGLVPFEALATGRQDGTWRYLLEEDLELVYLNTGRELGRLALTVPEDKARGKSAVLVGNPAFDAPSRQLIAVAEGLDESTRLTQADRTGLLHDRSATLHAGGPEAPRVKVPRRWRQHDSLADLVDISRDQLEDLGWSVSRWLDRDALEQRVTALRSPRILQFATHGYTLDAPSQRSGWQNPLLRSMLILAGWNQWSSQEAEFYVVDRSVLSRSELLQRGLDPASLGESLRRQPDGLLTAYEVTGMDLRGTDLVNLTACETGMGQVSGEGVIGLRSAFLLAGARSLTISLWEVPAAETPRQITDFYQRWLGSESPGRYQAYRASQRKALAAARAASPDRYERAMGHRVNAHPFYWASTIYVGDPGDLPRIAITENPESKGEK